MPKDATQNPPPNNDGPVKDAKGRFMKGHSGNAGGRSKEKHRIMKLCQEYGEEAVELIVSIMRDTQESSKVRLVAANTILDRGYGKPAITTIEESDDGMTTPQIIVPMTPEQYDQRIADIKNKQLADDDEDED